MHRIVSRHLGKLMAAAAIAVTGTAVMVAVTLPGDAGAADGSGSAEAGREAAGGDSASGAGARAGKPGVVEEEAPTGERGTGRDALTDDELERAERLAATPALRRGSEDVDGDGGPQWISTDLAELTPSEVGDATPPRRAEITYYDYKDDTLVLKTVNLTSGEVDETKTLSGEQPPPTRAEAAEAVRLLLADPLGGGLKKDYKDATGKALTRPDQLEATGLVYRADEENSGPAALRACGDHRCVRLFTKVRNGPWIDTRHLVIDLSARSVGRLS